MAAFWREWCKATEENLKARWCGGPPGVHFRCGLCGFRFKLGDEWRGVMANVTDSPTRYGNFLTCRGCWEELRGDVPAILWARRQMEDQAEALADKGIFVDREGWERRRVAADKERDGG